MLKKKISLEDVLNDYIASEPNPDYEALNRWVSRFPQYRKELTEFTAHWSHMENLPPHTDTKDLSEDTLILRAMSIVGDRIHALQSKKQSTQVEMTDLLAEAKRQNLTIKDIADRSGLSVPIIAKMGRGLLDSSSIPKLAIERLAEAMGRTTEEATAFLQRPMKPAYDLWFRAKEQPKPPEKHENFFDAIRNDRTLSDEQLAFGLSLEKTP